MISRLHYDAATLIREYYQTIKGNYNLTEEDISLICRYQFILTRRTIEAGSLATIRIKYMGTFTVFKGRVIGLFKRAKKLRADHKITAEDMERIELMATNYMEHENDTLPLDEMD